MKANALTALLLPLLGACIIAVDLPDDRHDRAVEASLRGKAGRSAHGTPSGVISGKVVDADGNPVQGHVSAVHRSGSYSIGARGPFAFQGMRPDTYTIHVGTDDGQVALARGVKLGSRSGVSGLELVTEPGATVELALQGERETARCAIFHQGTRILDFTLRKGEPVSVVVPEGSCPVQLYDGDSVWAADQLELAAGDSETRVFELK